MNQTEHAALVRRADHGIYDITFIVLICALGAQYSRAVPGGAAYLVAYLVRLIRDYQQRCLLVFLVEDLESLSGCELEDDRVERLVPSEQ